MKTYSETYHVSGTLARAFSNTATGSMQYNQYKVDQEIKATNPQAAADSFEINRWEWVDPPAVWLVSEAMKLERAGQPSLFPLDEVEL